MAFLVFAFIKTIDWKKIFLLNLNDKSCGLFEDFFEW